MYHNLPLTIYYHGTGIVVFTVTVIALRASCLLGMVVVIRKKRLNSGNYGLSLKRRAREEHQRLFLMHRTRIQAGHNEREDISNTTALDDLPANQLEKASFACSASFKHPTLDTRRVPFADVSNVIRTTTRS
jgi:hypothetical protein